MHHLLRRITAFCFALVIASTHTVNAQTFSVLHKFTGGTDGAYPLAGLTIGPGGVLYGTAQYGGSHQGGVVFRMNQVNSAWVFTPIYQFTGGSDGLRPIGGVVFGSGGALYGTTQQGGVNNNGVVFALRPPSTFCRSISCTWNERVLHAFTGVPDGFYPENEKLLFDGAGNIYGTTGEGGAHGGGTVFALSPSGGGQYTESILYNFSGPDGAYPAAGVIFDAAGNLYGTTSAGGTGRGCQLGCGTAYQLTPSNGGWQENVLVNFDFGRAGLEGGIYPYSGLVADASGNLYGTTIYSGQNSLNGIVYKLAPSNGTFTPSLAFAFPSSCQPYGGVTMDSAGNFFGICLSAGSGSVFELTNCSQSCVMIDLHDFDGFDGLMPYGTPVLDGNGNLYGTTQYGGLNYNCNLGCGVVWEIAGVDPPGRN